MKNRSINVCKNALGTMFLLMGAFLVCSTFFSMKSVLADPVGPVFGPETQGTQVQSGRASGRTSPRAGGNTATAARPTANSGRTVASRGVTARTQSATNQSPARTATQATNTRNVVARTSAKPATSTRVATTTRNVRPRTATSADQARISHQGDAIRGVKNTTSTYYTYLSGKLYSGNYSNIIDSTTGLISADAYSNCLESYYTCMDEICTARNEAQRRCACAGRVKAFAEAEAALKSANEELIKVSGELALFIANKGKEVSAAFSLTDAEKVMNCASWREVAHWDNTGAGKSCDSDSMKEWCESHGEYTTCNCTTPPTYCNASKNNYLFDVKNLDGAGSDILASLAKWADDVKESTDTILKYDNQNLFETFSQMTSTVNGLYGSTSALVEGETTDTLAETWGYDLFRYAHNNVCARVLDSCFNGIYEGCGTPPSGGRCANGAFSSCPFNYNSKIDISSSGDVVLNERSTIGTNASAACFGYTSTSGDPYSALRGPVADARRSVMQKYLLDANADCDLYGEQLKASAQKITYQKVAAQQALQQKRLEFYNEDQSDMLARATAAGTNFNECISELWDCYETQTSSNPSWPDARIKTYCAQIANVPHCYQEMVCNPSYSQTKAVVEAADNSQCTWHASRYSDRLGDGNYNTCRNIITLQEILRGTGEEAWPENSVPVDGDTYSSAALRAQCLNDALGCWYSGDGNDACVRNWANENRDSYNCVTQGKVWYNNDCYTEEEVCELQDKTWYEETCWTKKQYCESVQGKKWYDGGCVAQQYYCETVLNKEWYNGQCMTEQAACQAKGKTWSNGQCIGTNE